MSLSETPPKLPRLRRNGRFGDHQILGKHAFGGEERVACLLQEQLPEEAEILCNVSLMDNGRLFEIDTIVVVPQGVAVIEVKGWPFARFTGANECYRQNNHRCDDPRRSVGLKATVLHSILRKKFSSVTTQPLVLFGSDDAKLEGDLFRAVPVKHLTEGIESIASGDLFKPSRETRPRLNATQISAVADEIWGAPAEKQRRYFVSGYQLVTPLRDPASSPFGQEFIGQQCKAQDSFDTFSERLRIRRFQIGLHTEYEQQQAFRSFSERLSTCLARLAEHSPRICVPQLKTSFSDPSDDTYYFTVYEGVFGCPIDKLHASKHTALLIQAADVLAISHSADIVHRALRPESLVRRDQTDDLYILHFDVARIGNMQTIRKALTADQFSTQYVAPEVRLDPSQATPASDIYSLGVIATELFSGCPLPSAAPEAAAKVVAQLRQRTLVPLLQHMVTPDPANRLRNMSKVATALRTARYP